MTTAEKLYAQGREKVIQKGMEKGIQKGMEKGIASMQREAILNVLRARFGEIPAALDTSIRREDDSEKLDRLLVIGARARDLTEFLDANRGPSKS